jgi:hypothetical protein
MKQQIKCIILNVDTVLITEIQELMVDIGEPDCKLINPFEYNDDHELVSWPSTTDQREIMIKSDDILTIVEPKEEIIEKYLELVNN